MGWFERFVVFSIDRWAMKKKVPGCLVYIGGEILPSYIGIIISHEIRIPIDQPV